MRKSTLAIALVLVSVPAVAQQPGAAQQPNALQRTAPSVASGSDVGPFKPGNPVLNPIEPPPPAPTALPSTVMVAPPLTPEQALAAEMAARYRVERTERSMDRVENANDRNATRAAIVTPPPIAGAFTGSTDPRDR
jgi:hypothetical protein